MSKIEIRVAREKKPQLQHRPFYEREKELNKMSREDMLKKWRMRLDPYKMHGIRKFEDGKDNPFQYMSLYKIEQFIKTLEKSEQDFFKEENEQLEFAVDMIVTFKDLLHITTSEAVAVWLIFKDKLNAHVGKTKRDFTDEEGAQLAREAIHEFQDDWNTAMANLEKIWKK